MEKEYYLYVRGQKVEVSEDIYKVYWQEREHEKYLEQVDRKNHLLFFSSLDHDGHFIDNIIDETVVLLSHKKPDSQINVKVEFGDENGKFPIESIAEKAEEYKPKEKVTYKMIQSYIKEKYNLKMHTAYIAEVKRNSGMKMQMEVKSEGTSQDRKSHPSKEKVEIIKDALSHFNLI